MNSETWHPFVHFFAFLLKDQKSTQNMSAETSKASQMAGPGLG